MTLATVVEDHCASGDSTWRGNLVLGAYWLLVAADLPPFEALELSHFFGAVIRVPAVPGERVRRNVGVCDFLERQEGPGAHLRARFCFGGEIDEFRHHAQALLPREDSAIGNVAAGAIAHLHRGIFREGGEQFIEDFVFGEKTKTLDGPLPDSWIFVVARVVEECLV